MILALQKIATGLDETISAVVEIIEKTEPVAPVVDDINANLDAAVSALEGLLVKKAGMADAVGLVDGLYPGRGRRRASATSRTARRPRRRGSRPSTRAARSRSRGWDEKPRSPPPARNGPALRNARRAAAWRPAALYLGERPGRSPVIGTNAPVQYEASDADPSTV